MRILGLSCSKLNEYRKEQFDFCVTPLVGFGYGHRHFTFASLVNIIKVTLVLPTSVDTGMSVSCAYSVSSSGG